MEAGSAEKVEEYVVLHQEPSASENISPKVARPYIQALHSINLHDLSEAEEQKMEEVESIDKDSAVDDRETESQTEEGPAQIDELNAVMEQVALLFLYLTWKVSEVEKSNKLKKYSQMKTMFCHDDLIFTFTYPSTSWHQLNGMPCITWSTFTSVTMKQFLR